MNITEFLKYFPEYYVTKAQLAYAEYLQRCGLLFLVDFGFENAESIAWDKLEAGDYMLGHA